MKFTGRAFSKDTLELDENDVQKLQAGAILNESGLTVVFRRRPVKALDTAAHELVAIVRSRGRDTLFPEGSILGNAFDDLCVSLQSYQPPREDDDE